MAYTADVNVKLYRVLYTRVESRAAVFTRATGHTDTSTKTFDTLSL